MKRFGSHSQPDDPEAGRRDQGRSGEGKRKWTTPPQPNRSATRHYQQHTPPPGQRPQDAQAPQDAAQGSPGQPSPGQTPPGQQGRPGPPPPRGARPYPPRGNSTYGEQAAGAAQDYERYGADGYAASNRESPEGPRGPGEGTPDDGKVGRTPRKLTVTRVAALRSRHLSGRAVDAFQRAAKADGADKSGLTALSYAVMVNYASDAAMMVALANTLFFSPTSADSSKAKIALFLLVTIAPFGLIAPVIGPALDRIQRGRRLAMCIASAGQALMCVVMALNFEGWLLYPAALGMMVLSKSFSVLKAAITPRVVPAEITLSKTNARLTIFGLAAGGVGGAAASGFNSTLGSASALWFTSVICVAGAVQSMRIPSWVEVTEGEVPTTLLPHQQAESAKKTQPTKRQAMGPHVVLALWGNGTVRVLTGFLMMFAAFVVKAQTQHEPVIQLLLLGTIAGAAGLGGFVGNALGSRLQFGKSDQVILGCLAGTLLSTVLATVFGGVFTAAIVGLVGATASALAKISLDAVIQEDLPEQSRASAFGRSETVLQLSWCCGGAVGLLLPSVYWIGFLTVSALVALGTLQTYLLWRGSSLIPGRGGKPPNSPDPVGPAPGSGKPRGGPVPTRQWPSS